MAFYASFLAAVILAWCVQLLRTRYRAHLKSIPGPFAASISNLWKLLAVYHEDMPGWNIAVHEEYGPVVRIGPKHVSFSSPAAFQAIYTSRKAFPKSNFYEVGAPTYAGKPLENLFSFRDVQRHATLKRNIGGLYTKAAVKDFEPNIDHCINLFMRQLADRTRLGKKATFDMSFWLHLYAFDCLSAVNLGRPLGFLETGKDVRDMIGSADKIFVMVGLFTQAPALQWLLGRLRSLAPAEESEPALKLTLQEVEARRRSPEKGQTDMLSRFLDLHKDSPDKVPIRDITAAIFINLTAGHDVLAITLRAIWYHLAHNPRVLKKLRAEIESASSDGPADSVVSYSTVSGLEYLNAVILETLRIHPNTGTIIERKVPDEGAMIDGYFIPGSTIVGVNAWVLHRSELFGHDTDVFRPERWLDAMQEAKLEMSRNLFSFGAGAHSCIGKNTAMIMITKLVFEFYRRYDTAMAYPNQDWKIHGSWVTKQTEMDMVVSRL